MNVRAIVFDFDDTLSDESASFDAALRRTIAPVLTKIRLDGARLIDDVRTTARQLWRSSNLNAQGRTLKIGFNEVFSTAAWGDGTFDSLLEEFGRRLRPEVWRSALDSQGVRDEELVGRLVSGTVKNGTGTHTPYEGTANVLAALQGRFPMGLLTNGNSLVQRAKLVRSGLGHLFDATVVSGDLIPPRAKPDPAAFLRVLDLLECESVNTVMVGDNLVNDIGAAAALGMRTVWVDRNGDTPPPGVQPDHAVTDLTELIDLL